MRDNLNEVRYGKVKISDWGILKSPDQHPYDLKWYASRAVKYEKRIRAFGYTKQRKKARYKKALTRFFKRYYREEF